MKTQMFFAAAAAAAMLVGSNANALTIYPKFAVSPPATCEGKLGAYQATFKWDGLNASGFTVGGKKFDTGKTRIGDEQAIAFGDNYVALVTYAFPAPGVSFDVDYFAVGATDKHGPAKGHFVCK